MDILRQVSKLRINLLVIFSVLEVFLFGGLPYGWNSLVFVLKSQKVFHSLCDAETNSTSGHGLHGISSAADANSSKTSTTCPEQESRFNLLFAIALAIGTFGTLYIGVMVDKIGTKITRLVHTIAFIGGAMLLGFTSEESPWFILPGLILIGLGGFALLLSNMRVAILLPKGGAVYTGVLNGSLDSSVITFLIVKNMYENGVSQILSFVAVTVCFTLVSSICTVLHIVNEPQTVLIVKQKNNKVKMEYQQREHKKQENIHPEINTKEVANKKDTSNTSAIEALLSADFIMHIIWTSSNVLSYILFIGSASILFECRLENESEISHYTNILGYIMTCGIVTSTLSGGFQEWQKSYFQNCADPYRRNVLPLVSPLAITSVLSVILNLLTFIDVKEILYVSFISLILLRSFIFSVNMNYSIQMFPLKHMTFIFGTNMSILSIMNLVQYPLFIWMNSYENARSHVSLYLIGGSVLSLLHPTRLWIKAMLMRKDKEQNRNSNIIKQATDIF